MRALKKNKEARKQELESQLPQTPGDMAVKKKDDAGRLVSLEVTSTPRGKRPPVAEGATAWKQACSSETTPERALRKMKAKVKYQVEKAARGEEERIVARHDGSGGEATQGEGALAQLDNPLVLEHIRSALLFLVSARLHYCANCDEQWPVFAAEFPQIISNLNSCKYTYNTVKTIDFF